ncbi:MAG: hypothetical protein ISR96_09635 [Nitrospira sp.]|nr:hypothetical protein [bacterium]MBL7049761.1 hypothetical protein [Nitrospira sp.]
MRTFIFTATILILAASNTYSDSAQSNALNIPHKYGRVIYSTNHNSPNQLYIIGISHRDSIHLKNSSNTVQSQIETFRIAEWLIQNKGISMILPEGYFSSSQRHTAPIDRSKNSPLNIEILQERLTDESVFTNAEMLLREKYGILSRQIEDLNMYQAVSAKMKELKISRNDLIESQFIISELTYLQNRRTANMLQQIPDILDKELKRGSISNKQALLTIGMNHISEIIKYLKQGRIEIASPLFMSYKDFYSELQLRDNNYGVSVIIPEILANDNELIKLVMLDDIQ